MAKGDMDFLRSHVTILSTKVDAVARSEPSDELLRAVAAHSHHEAMQRHHQHDEAPTTPGNLKATKAAGIRVELSGDAWLSKLWGLGPVPFGAEVLGRVFRGEDCIGGMLIRHPGGLYSDGRAGSSRTLDRFAVDEAIRRADA